MVAGNRRWREIQDNGEEGREHKMVGNTRWRGIQDGG